MMNHIGISCRHTMNPHYLCLSHHLSCQGDMPMVEKTLAKNYKVSPEHFHISPLPLCWLNWQWQNVDGIFRSMGSKAATLNSANVNLVMVIGRLWPIYCILRCQKHNSCYCCLTISLNVCTKLLSPVKSRMLWLLNDLQHLVVLEQKTCDYQGSKKLI